MLDLNIADSNIKQMLYVFRYFYSNAFKFNIMMHSEDWNLPENVLNSDIMSLLKKDIADLKKKYITNSEDKGKLEYAEGNISELLKLKFDNNKSLVECFYIAYKTMKTLLESKQYLIAKWFIISFFEKYIPVVFKAYDVYSKGQSEIVLGIKYEYNGVFMNGLCNGLGDLAKEILRTDTCSADLRCKYHLMSKYILTLNKDNGYVDNKVLIYLYKMYLMYKDNPNEEAANDLDNDFNNNELEKIVYYVDDNGSELNEDHEPIILDSTKFLQNNIDKNRLINIIRQTAKVVRGNEGLDVEFNISEDFKMYFITNKEDYRPVFLKMGKRTYTIISYGDNIYLLYMKDNKNVYGIALVSWFNDPNSIIKIEPDNDGKFEFFIDNITV